MTGQGDANVHESRPRLLDLYCGAGGAARGYQLAGFDVTGIDHRAQRRYAGDRFLEGDALAGLRALLNGNTICGGLGLGDFAAIHASPPCQEYSSAGKAAKVTLGRVYPDLYAETRDLIEQTGLPWAIENVTAAPSRSGVVLCGSMFGLPIQRHRTFESSHLMLLDRHCDHKPDAITITGHSPQQWLGGRRQTVPRAKYEAAMGIDWMLVSELVQAIPPAYTEWIGAQLLTHVRQEVSA